MQYFGSLYSKDKNKLPPFYLSDYTAIMSLEKTIFILFAFLIAMGIFYLNVRKKVALKRSLNMVFLRVIIARKDSDSDEKNPVGTQFTCAFKTTKGYISSKKIPVSFMDKNNIEYEIKLNGETFDVNKLYV
jgi:hypothetical protein